MTMMTMTDCVQQFPTASTRSNARPATTNLATLRAIAKKCPDKAAAGILRNLVASTPGAEGK